jgi:hypothetical protein
VFVQLVIAAITTAPWSSPSPSPCERAAGAPSPRARASASATHPRPCSTAVAGRERERGERVLPLVSLAADEGAQLLAEVARRARRRCGTQADAGGRGPTPPEQGRARLRRAVNESPLACGSPRSQKYQPTFSAPQKRANSRVGRPPLACSPDWRSQTSVSGSAPSDHRQRRMPKQLRDLLGEDVRAGAGARVAQARDYSRRGGVWPCPTGISALAPRGRTGRSPRADRSCADKSAASQTAAAPRADSQPRPGGRRGCRAAHPSDCDRGTRVGYLVTEAGSAEQVGGNGSFRGEHELASRAA